MNLAARFLKLNIGLMLLGLSVSIMLNAHVGVDPWSVFHDGLARHLPISFGLITLISGLAALGLSALWLKAPMGLGSALNILLIGPYVDLFNWSKLVPIQDAYLPGLLQLIIGIVGMALAIGLYVNAGFGAGPREGLVLGLSTRYNISIRTSKTILEVVILSLGIGLGGQFGVGTLLFAGSIGFLMQLSLKILPKPISLMK